MAATRRAARQSVLGASLICAALLVTMAAGASAGASTGQRAGVLAQASQRLWVRRYAGLGLAEPAAIATSPSGDRVFVTGDTSGFSTPADFATVAYAAATGVRLWVSRYNGPANGPGGAGAIAVSPDGTRVFVTGTSVGSRTSDDFATIAYDTATGLRLWVRRYNDPRNGRDNPSSMALSPDGRTVYVTGTSNNDSRFSDYTTIAYSAATGAELWMRHYDGPAHSYDQASALAVGPDGRTVIVTGSSFGRGTLDDFATIAYDAASGRRLWVRRFNGPASGLDDATSAAFSPDGKTVYVAGWSGPTDTAERARYITIAYAAATGRRRWLSSYAGPRHGGSFAFSVAVGPFGQAVFVTGSSHGLTSKSDYATIAYNAATGARLWLRRYNGPANGRDIASMVAVSRSGSRVYVTGVSMGATSGYDYETIAYTSGSGRRLWADRYNGPGNADDLTRAMTVGSTGVVYVTGESTVDTASGQFVATTIAYQG